MPRAVIGCAVGVGAHGTMACEVASEAAGRQGRLLLVAALPALAASLGLAVHAWQSRTAELAAAFEARAREHHRALEAVLGGPLDAEAEGPAARDVAGAHERIRALAASLDATPGRLRLVREGEEVPDGGSDSVPALSLRQSVGASGLVLEHRLERATLRAAAFAAAAPWLVAGLLLVATLGLAQRLVRRRILDPMVAALDALEAVASGRASAAAPAPWLAPRLERAARAARARRDQLAAAEAGEARLRAALDAVAQPVAILDQRGGLLLANAALARLLEHPDRCGESGSTAPPEPAAALLLAAAERAGPVRELVLASGERIRVWPAPERPPVGASDAPVGPLPAAVAQRIQELGEALAEVARQTVLLHELAADPATRTRAEASRRAARRCTRLIAPLLVPKRPSAEDGPPAITADRQPVRALAAEMAESARR